MKHLGKIESGGSLDITNNKHVEGLIEETLKGIDIPEDTNTTYTLTQDGLTVQLVDDGGNTVSTIEIPKLEDENTTYTLSKDGTTIRLVGSEGGSSEVDLASLLPEEKDPYQEEKAILFLPPANLFSMIRSNAYDDFDFTTDFDAENNLISIYLHLYSNYIVRTFTLADNVSNEWTRYDRAGSPTGYVDIITLYKDGTSVRVIGINRDSGSQVMYTVSNARLDSPPNNHSDGIALRNNLSNTYYIFPDVNEETVADQQVITGTLEEHLQNIYGYIHQ